MERAPSLPAVALLAIVAIAPGCDSSIRAACERGVPAFRTEITLARGEFPSLAEMGTRAPASRAEPRTLPENRREEWQEWARRRLIEVQGLLDVSVRDSEWFPHRRRLTETANEIVEFAGYAEVGDSLRMSRSLERIAGFGEELDRTACPGPRAP